MFVYGDMMFTCTDQTTSSPLQMLNFFFFFFKCVQFIFFFSKLSFFMKLLMNICVFLLQTDSGALVMEQLHDMKAEKQQVFPI